MPPERPLTTGAQGNHDGAACVNFVVLVDVNPVRLSRAAVVNRRVVRTRLGACHVRCNLTDELCAMIFFLWWGGRGALGQQIASEMGEADVFAPAVNAPTFIAVENLLNRHLLPLPVLVEQTADQSGVRYFVASAHDALRPNEMHEPARMPLAVLTL